MGPALSSSSPWTDSSRMSGGLPRPSKTLVYIVTQIPSRKFARPVAPCGLDGQPRAAGSDPLDIFLDTWSADPACYLPFRASSSFKLNGTATRHEVETSPGDDPDPTHGIRRDQA